MPSIVFKAKIDAVHSGDGAVSRRFIKVPRFTRGHCNMHEFRTSARYGSYANSDLFLAMLNRDALKILGMTYHRELLLDRLPEGVSVDESGFLAKITRTVLPSSSS